MPLLIITKEELSVIVSQHRDYLLGNPNGKRANLTGANLSGANLTGANLSVANLTGANLSEANLYWANLSEANLTRANLSEADLSGANLYGVNLSEANLTRANLYGANLSEADLSGANLYGANLSGANLTRANLSEADLSRANLYGANLTGANLYVADLYGANLYEANLSGAKDIPALAIATTRVAPPEGPIIGWKKCRRGIIVKLRVPEEARRSNAFGRKCRAEFVDVLEVVGAEVGVSDHDGKTEYRVGQRVTCHQWGENFTFECAGGIHFFITREEAEAY